MIVDSPSPVDGEEFPASAPFVEFLRGCLTKSPADRPDHNTLRRTDFASVAVDSALVADFLRSLEGT